MKIKRIHINDSKTSMWRFRTNLLWAIVAMVLFNIAYVIGADTYQNTGTYVSNDGATVVVDEYDVYLNDTELEYKKRSSNSWLTDHWIMGSGIYFGGLMLLLSYFVKTSADEVSDADHD